MSNGLLILHLAVGMLLLTLIVRDRLEMRRRMTLVCVGLLVLTGAYNFMTRMTGAPAGWHIMIGVKILLALHTFAMVLLVLRGHDDPAKVELWRRNAFYSAVAVIVIGLYYSNFSR